MTMIEFEKIKEYLNIKFDSDERGTHFSRQESNLSGSNTKSLVINISDHLQTLSINAISRRDGKFIKVKNLIHTHLTTEKLEPLPKQSYPFVIHECDSEEAIKYIDSIYNEIWIDEYREERLKKLLDK